MIFTWWRNRRRRRWLAEPFPDAWREIVAQNVPLAERLNATERERLENFVRVFIPETFWEGCNGLEMNDEVRVTIAAQAGLLTLGYDHFFFERLQTVLVYPDRYVVDAQHHLPGGVVAESRDVRLGEAWVRGPVVLVWPDVLHGGRKPDDGRNVVLHEFAHLLDMGDDAADGVPFLGDDEHAVTWREVTQRAYRKLVRDTEQGRRTLLDTYGSTNEAEFFAVATEAFFERSQDMARQMPDLYEVLSRFYRQDPASR